LRITTERNNADQSFSIERIAHENVGLRYDAKPLPDHVSFEALAGSMLAIVGVQKRLHDPQFNVQPRMAAA